MIVESAPLRRPFFVDLVSHESGTDVDLPGTSSIPFDDVVCESETVGSPEAVVRDSTQVDWFEKALVGAVKGFGKAVNGLRSLLEEATVNLPRARDPPPFEDDKDVGPTFDTKGMTKRIMKRIPVEGQASGAGGASTWEAFKRVEQSW
jgi:hypothetical protein